MHIEFLVEESSAEAALQNIVPRVVELSVSFAIHPYQGKPDLLKKLPSMLKGYRAWLPRDWGIVVVLDTDRDDCHELKGQLEQMAAAAGLLTKSAVPVGSRFQVLNRLAMEELEAWFFGDSDALHAAYPRLPQTIRYQHKYRNPDAIPGGAAEALEVLLRRAGYYRTGLAKIQAARDISIHMRPENNRSRSFQAFRSGLQQLASQELGTTD